MLKAIQISPISIPEINHMIEDGMAQKVVLYSEGVAAAAISAFAFRIPKVSHFPKASRRPRINRAWNVVLK